MTSFYFVEVCVLESSMTLICLRRQYADMEKKFLACVVTLTLLYSVFRKVTYRRGVGWGVPIYPCCGVERHPCRCIMYHNKVEQQWRMTLSAVTQSYAIAKYAIPQICKP